MTLALKSLLRRNYSEYCIAEMDIYIDGNETDLTDSHMKISSCIIDNKATHLL